MTNGSCYSTTSRNFNPVWSPVRLASVSLTDGCNWCPDRARKNCSHGIFVLLLTHRLHERSGCEFKNAVVNLVQGDVVFRFSYDNTLTCRETLPMIRPYGVGPVRRQAITWANVDPYLSHHMASLGCNVKNIIRQNLRLLTKLNVKNQICHTKTVDIIYIYCAYTNFNSGLGKPCWNWSIGK